MALAPSDFTPPEGHESVIVMAFTVGAPVQTNHDGVSWWSVWDGFGTTGTLVDGSDVTLRPGADVEAVNWRSSGYNRLSFFLPDNGVNALEAFTEGFAQFGQIHIIREVPDGENQSGSFSYPNTSDSFYFEGDEDAVRFTGGSSGLSGFETVAEQVVEGDSVLIAVTRQTAAQYIPPDGHEILAVLGIIAGDETTWYRSSTNPPATGTLEMGSDALLVLPDQSITRVWWSNGVLVINDNPSDIQLSQTFGSGGAAENSTIHIITEDGSAHLPVADVLGLTGLNFANFGIDDSGSSEEEDWFDLAQAVEENDRLLIAFTRPVPPLGSTGALTGSLTGSISGAASLTPLDSTGALTGSLTGSIIRCCESDAARFYWCANRESHRLDIRCCESDAARFYWCANRESHRLDIRCCESDAARFHGCANRRSRRLDIRCC